MTALPESGFDRTLYLKAPKFNPATGLLGFLFLLALAFAIWGYAKGKGIFWEPPSLMFIPFALYYVAFAGWRIEIAQEEIAVVTFFWFRKTVQRLDIISWSAKTGWKPGERLNKPYRRIEILTANNRDPFVIPTKPLRYEDYQTLLSLLPAEMMKGKACKRSGSH